MSAQEQIQKTVNENDVVLYMKGTPVFPQCGFSSIIGQQSRKFLSKENSLADATL